MKKVRFLHIIQDEKFYYQTKKLFENDLEIDSEYIYFCWRKKNIINDSDGSLIIYDKSKDLRKKIKHGNYDVLYLHSLHFSIMKYIKYVPIDKIVIWWAWGADIYDGQLLGLKSYVHVKSMKSITNNVIYNDLPLRRIKIFITKLLFSIPYAYYRKQVLKRVDYFQPVIDVDYYLMKKYTGFKLNEYYPANWSNFYTGTEICQEKEEEGSILFGNSASPVQNHLDAWDMVKQYIPSNRLILLPLSYGTQDYGKMVKEKMIDHQHNIRVLDKILPLNEYCEIIGNCSYAIFGSIRQHAMGNIYNALRSGLKIFLFKESVIYEYLKNKGYIVFSIEDFNENSLRTPLSVEDQRKNLEAMKNELESYREKGKIAFDNIKQQVLKRRLSYENISHP